MDIYPKISQAQVREITAREKLYSLLGILWGAKSPVPGRVHSATPYRLLLEVNSAILNPTDIDVIRRYIKDTVYIVFSV